MKKRKAIHCIAVLVILVLTATAAYAIDIPERRKPQFETTMGYALFPYPYSLPGIGQGYGLVGGMMNIDNTTTDLYGMIFDGDIGGLALSLAEIQLLPEHLILDTGYTRLSAATVQNYGQRGMHSDKNDFANIEMEDMTYIGARLTATSFDRRLEFYGAYYHGTQQLKSIRDRDGNVIIEAQNSAVERGSVSMFGTRLDLTDDYRDPRRGVRIDTNWSSSPPLDNASRYYVVDYNATVYVPLGRRSTWAFNAFRSDAHVQRQGETVRTTIEQEQGVDCNSITNLADRQLCEDFLTNTIANNTYGTARSLGGFNQLRSYPAGRFSGAHTLFFGTEVRWNLTDESTPYDIFIMKDVRTSWQIALYYEMGSVADDRDELGDLWRSSTGVGLRMITASGVVFRADVAGGREGIAPSIFIGYPWEL